MNTGSANGQGWGVIDLPRNQSACWESTARPEQTIQQRRGWGCPKVYWEKNKREENKFNMQACKDQLIKSSWQLMFCSQSDQQALIGEEVKVLYRKYHRFLKSNC